MYFERKIKTAITTPDVILNPLTPPGNLLPINLLNSVSDKAPPFPSKDHDDFPAKIPQADAVATAVGNKVKKISDIENVLNWAIKLKDVDGVIVIKDSKVGMIGNIPRLLLSKDEKLRNKVTKDVVYEF